MLHALSHVKIWLFCSSCRPVHVPLSSKLILGIQTSSCENFSLGDMRSKMSGKEWHLGVMLVAPRRYSFDVSRFSRWSWFRLLGPVVLWNQFCCEWNRQEALPENLSRGRLGCTITSFTLASVCIEEPNNHSIVFLLRSLRQSMVLKDVQNRSRGITKHETKYVFNFSDLIIGRMTL